MFKISESAMGAVEFVDVFFEEAFMGHESFDERIIRLFQAFFLVEQQPYAKNISNEEMSDLIKKYITDNKISMTIFFFFKFLLFQFILNIFLFLLESELEIIDQKILLDVKTKIKLEKLVDRYNYVISPSTYDSLDALSSVVAFVMYDICEYLGVLKEEIVENKELALLNKPPAERIAIFNWEKQQYYSQKLADLDKKL